MNLPSPENVYENISFTFPYEWTKGLKKVYTEGIKRLRVDIAVQRPAEKNEHVRNYCAGNCKSNNLLQQFHLELMLGRLIKS